MASKKLTAAQQRDKRMRVVAIVLGCVFLLVCGIQVPRVLHQLHPSRAAAPASTATTADTAAAAAAALISATGPPAPQVARLSRFAWKNPFPQTATTTSPTATTAAPRTTPATAAAPPSATTAPTTTQATPPAPPTLTVPFAPTPTRPGVLLLVAGNRHALARGDAFPKATPLFRVVGFTPKVARLRLLTGTLPGGGEVLTLRLRHRLVLRNTSDGTSLALEYLRPAELALRPAAPKPAR
jgi:hypothetical protein